MKKYFVSRQVIYEQTVEVLANSEDEAIEIARTVSTLDAEKTFLDTDYYQIVDENE